MSEKRAQYRPAKGYAGFFADNDDIVIHRRYFWVIISSQEELEVWMSFVSEYVTLRDRKKEPAVFILEWQGSAIITRKKEVANLSFDEYIGEYDRIVYAMLASSEIRCDTFQKNYIAELASNVIGNDIELYAECIGHYKDFINNPYETVKQCVRDSCRSDNLSFIFEKSKEQVEHDIWLTQIRTVFLLSRNLEKILSINTDLL